MAIQLTVPSIACEGCAETVTKAIHAQDETAVVSVDVPGKVVTVTSQLGEADIRQAIVALGHEVA